MSSNPDTELDTPFWREHPHLFIPARWGPEFCRCCLDRADVAIHDVVTDPATHVGNCTNYRVARGGEVVFAVEAWSDNGAACSFGAQPTYQAALDFAEQIKANGDQGRTYDHIQIVERRYFTAVDANVMVLS